MVTLLLRRARQFSTLPEGAEGTERFLPLPDHRPWRSIGAPRNLTSMKLYRGINVWLLTAQGYTSPYWATIREINGLGGQVRKGEKATPVVFWRIYVDSVELKVNGDRYEPEQEQREGQGRLRLVLRYYSIFVRREVA
jgi:antirestriction protein ArdC